MFVSFQKWKSFKNECSFLTEKGPDFFPSDGAVGHCVQNILVKFRFTSHDTHMKRADFFGMGKNNQILKEAWNIF